MSIQSSDKNRCWIAVKYTKPQQFKTTSALKDLFGNVAMSMKDKETLVRKTAFPPPPKSSRREPRIPASTAHLSITRNHVYNTLMAQSTKKAPGPDKINFGILRMIWDWEGERMTEMI